MDLLAAAQRLVQQMLIRRGARSSTAIIHRHPVHYYELSGSGPGPPALLVHGLGGTANGFYKILFPLRRRFSRVIAPDLPGHGFSPLPAQPLGLRAQFEVLASFCEQKVGAPAFVVGNSLGGAMCIALAHERPELVCALALIAPAGARIGQEKLAEVFQAMKVTNSAQARALTRRLFHRAPVLSALFAPQLRKLYDTPAVRAILADIDERSFLAPELLSGLRVPTLLLWGGSEKLLPQEAVEYFRTHLPPSAQIQLVKGFGHVPQMERPREVVRYLVRFADQVRI